MKTDGGGCPRCFVRQRGRFKAAHHSYIATGPGAVDQSVDTLCVGLSTSSRRMLL